MRRMSVNTIALDTDFVRPAYAVLAVNKEPDKEEHHITLSIDGVSFTQSTPYKDFDEAYRYMELAASRLENRRKVEGMIG